MLTYAKSWGTNKVHYGRCASSVLVKDTIFGVEHTIKTQYSVHSIVGHYLVVCLRTAQALPFGDVASL